MTLNTYHKTFIISSVSIIGYLVMSAMLSIWMKSCSDENTSHAYFPIVISDTTKPQIKPKPIANKYVLTGNDTMFQLLFNQIYSPEDVTPRNTAKLKEWLSKNVRQDTTNVK